jgi:hypothetical protein
MSPSLVLSFQFIKLSLAIWFLCHMMITLCSKIWPCCWAANQDGQGIPNSGDAQLLEAGILMNNLLTSSSANEGSTDSTGVPVPTILAAVGANHRMIEIASLALST